MSIDQIVDTASYPVSDGDFQTCCATTLEDTGVLVLPDFIRPKALDEMRQEAIEGEAQAYFCAQDHSIYLTPENPDYSADHPENRKVVSSKGCICDDQVGQNSPLRTLYDSIDFRGFIAGGTGQAQMNTYADPLSSINVHYAKRGQELGWHFDNSSFAITLLIRKPDAGSRFEYFKDLRDVDAGEMNYDGVGALLDGKVQPEVL